MAGRRKSSGPPPADDAALWARVTGNVKPLRNRSGAAPRPSAAGTAGEEAKPKARAASAPAPARSASQPPGSVPVPLAPGAAPGLDRRTAQRLRRGQLRIEGHIDLHGMTQAEAHANLARFLNASAAGGRRCVLVITGKGLRGGAGTGILRAELPRWLNEASLRPLVLSFAPAQPKDGGGGAFYVYLRKARDRSAP